MLALLPALAFAGCKKDEALEDAPNACLSQDMRVVAVADTVRFKFCGSATSAHWEFGDGNAADGAKDQAHSYPAPGDYLASVKAKSASGRLSDFAAILIHVGRPYPRNMEALVLPSTDSQGSPWDLDGTGPDLVFQWRPQGATAWAYTSDAIADASVNSSMDFVGDMMPIEGQIEWQLTDADPMGAGAVIGEGILDASALTAAASQATLKDAGLELLLRYTVK